MRSIATSASPAGASAPERTVAPDAVGVGAVIAAAEAALQGLTSASAAEGWSAADRQRALGAVDRATSTLAALRARLLAAEQAAGTWALHGDRSLAAWRARTSRQGAAAGAAQVRQAETLATLPRVAEALTSGSVTTTHLDAIARLTGNASPDVAERIASADGQAHLVQLAGRLNGTAYGKALARWQAELDPAARQRAHDQQQAARYVHLTHTPGGTHLKGLLDTVAGHRLQLALEAVTPRPALDDDRTPEQRRADALVMLADRTLEDPATAVGAAVRPHVSLVIGESTWAALRRSHRGGSVPPPGSVTPPGSVPPPGSVTPPASAPALSERARRADATPSAPLGVGDATRLPHGGALQVGRALLDQPPVCDEDGTPWPASEVARVLCDCRLTRVVMGADSVPLDLGRTHRLFTGAQRRAATVRDGGCGWPSCGAAARWCELHHIRWWDRDGGGSDLDNAVLLCSYHHHLVHRRELTITRRPPGPPDAAARRTSEYVVTTPDGRTLAGPPPPPSNAHVAPREATSRPAAVRSVPKAAPAEARRSGVTRPTTRRVQPRGRPTGPAVRDSLFSTP